MSLCLESITNYRHSFIFLLTESFRGWDHWLDTIYGAKEHSRVNKIYQTSLILVLAIMAVGTVLCLCIPGTLIHLFTATPATIKIGSSALHIICLGFLVSSVSVTSSGALEGLGMGLPSHHLPLPLYADHHSAGFSSKPAAGSIRCLARIFGLPKQSPQSFLTGSTIGK